MPAAAPPESRVTGRRPRVGARRLDAEQRRGDAAEEHAHVSAVGRGKWRAVLRWVSRFRYGNNGVTRSNGVLCGMLTPWTPTANPNPGAGAVRVEASRRHAHRGSLRWDAVRRSVLKRAGYRCRRCGRGGRLEVDHVRPLHRGGAVFDLANLQALCTSCHVAKTRAENRGGGGGRPARSSDWSGYIDEISGGSRSPRLMPVD